MNNSSLFTDLDLRFEPHPESGDLFVLKDENAIKTALKNLIQLNFYDVPFDPLLGSNISNLLFEDFSVVTKLSLERNIQLLIHQHDNRIVIDKVLLEQIEEKHQLNITIEYYTTYSEELKTFSTIIKRTR